MGVTMVCFLKQREEDTNGDGKYLEMRVGVGGGGVGGANIPVTKYVITFA